MMSRTLIRLLTRPAELLGRNIRRLVTRSAARRRYFAADQTARQVWEEFAAPEGTWLSRWDALLTLADCERTMADSMVGFDDTDELDEDGFTPACWHAMSADLLGLVASTEMPIAAGADRSWDIRQALALAATARAGLDTDPAVAAVLAQMAAVTTLTERAELLAVLYTAVVGQVGGQAAEVLPWVAHGYYVASGLSLTQAQTQWRAVRESSNGGDQT